MYPKEKQTIKQTMPTRPETKIKLIQKKVNSKINPARRLALLQVSVKKTFKSW